TAPVLTKRRIKPTPKSLIGSEDPTTKLGDKRDKFLDTDELLLPGLIVLTIPVAAATTSAVSTNGISIQ
ncbi:hypothetical protein OnM2_103034, partial [Erysiphe neolycopersici]